MDNECRVCELDLWSGEFGDDYTTRNLPSTKNIYNRMYFLHDIMRPLQYKQNTILEVGTNVGANLVALDSLYQNRGQHVKLIGIEPNKKAREALKNQSIRDLTVINRSAMEIELPDNSVDVTLTCGVLIHINPIDLYQAMSEIYRVTKKYIICAEYFSAEPLQIKYRGREQLLWSRDFGNEWLSKFNLSLMSNGFAWKNTTGMDNLTWWMFRKQH